LVAASICTVATEALAEPPQTVERPAVTERQPGPNDTTLSILTYSGFAAVGVGVVVGSISGIWAISKTSKLKSDCGGTVCPAARQDDIASAKNLAGLSTVSFAFALIGAVVGFNGYTLWKDSSKSTAAANAVVHVKPVVGLGSAGLEGSF
jgi:hypothetical protein